MFCVRFRTPKISDAPAVTSHVWVNASEVLSARLRAEAAVHAIGLPFGPPEFVREIDRSFVATGKGRDAEYFDQAMADGVAVVHEFAMEETEDPGELD